MRTGYTVTEQHNPDSSATWTVRRGRKVVARIQCPQEHGMWDTDLIRAKLAELSGIPTADHRELARRVTAERGRRETAVAPHRWYVETDDARPETAPETAEEPPAAPSAPVAEERPATAVEGMQPGDRVVVRARIRDTFSGRDVEQPAFAGTFLGYWRNGRYWVQEDAYGTRCTYRADEIFPAPETAAEAQPAEAGLTLAQRFPLQARLRGGQLLHRITAAQFAGDPATTACGKTARTSRHGGGGEWCPGCVKAFAGEGVGVAAR